jgi:hypothetical protein
LGFRTRADGSTVKIVSKRRSPKAAPPAREYVTSEDFLATVEDFGEMVTDLAALVRRQAEAITALTTNFTSLVDALAKRG